MKQKEVKKYAIYAIIIGYIIEVNLTIILILNWVHIYKCPNLIFAFMYAENIFMLYHLYNSLFQKLYHKSYDFWNNELPRWITYKYMKMKRKKKDHPHSKLQTNNIISTSLPSELPSLFVRIFSSNQQLHRQKLQQYIDESQPTLVWKNTSNVNNIARNNMLKVSNYEVMLIQ